MKDFLTFFFHSGLSNKPITLITCFIATFLFITIISVNSQNAPKKEDSCELILIRETLKPVNPQNAVIYFSTSHLMEKKDSFCISFNGSSTFKDTIYFNGQWKYPVYLKLNLKFDDMTRISNTFHYDSQIKKWEVAILDSSLMVKHKPTGDNFKRHYSLTGIVLIINTALEMFLALIISRLFGWPHILVVMVLVANVAAFPIYLLSLPGLLLREMLVGLIKILIMITVGYRKIKPYKIILFALFLIIFSLGIKELLFFLSNIL